MRRRSRSELRGPLRVRRMNVAWGIGSLVVLAITVTLLFWRPALFRGGYDVRAAFQTSNNLQIHSPVRIAGVRVGSVEKVDAGRDGRGAIVTMHVDDGVVLHSDARLKIRPRLLFEGAYYVDVQPGSPSQPPLKTEDGVIGVQQTATPVQVGEVLTALQSNTRRQLQVVLDEYGRALEDGGGAKGINRSMRYWKDAYRDTAIANDASLGEADDDVNAFIEHGTTVASALDRDPVALTSFVDNLAVAATALARHDSALQAAIGELPRTFAEGTRAMAAVGTALPPLRRLVADLRPTVRSARPAVTEGKRLMRQAAALMSPGELGRLAPHVRAAAPPLARLTRSSVPLNRQLRALSACQVHTVYPVSEERVPDRQFPTEHPVYQEFALGLPGLSGVSRSFDANGKYFKTGATAAQYAYALRPGEFFLTGTPLAGVNPGPLPAPALRPDAPCEDQDPPDLRSEALPAPPAIKVDQSAPGAARRRARAQSRAIRWLRRDLRHLGLAKDVPVLTDPLTRAQLPELRRQSAALRRGR